MKWRFLTMSSVISVAMAMLVAGLYTGEVLDRSVETYFEGSRMPDIFIEFARPVNESEVSVPLNASADSGAHQLRLKLSGTYDWEGESIAALFIGVRDPARDDINRLTLESGRLFGTGGEAVAVSGLEAKDVRSGARLRFNLSGKELSLNITGTVTGPEFIMSSAYADYLIPVQGSLVVVIMPLEDLQRGLGPVVNEALVMVKSGGSSEGVVRSLEGVGVQAVTMQDSHPSRTFMDLGASKMRAMMPLMSAIFMVIGLISIFMTMMKLVQNDSRYIGVLMSMGYGRREIAWSYMLLGLVLCAIGAVAGVILAVLFTMGIAEASLAMFFTVQLDFPFSPLPFLAGIAYTVGCVMLSVSVPVLIVTRRSVKEALEYKPTLKVRRSKGSAGRMSTVAVMGLRNAVRHPKRTAITVAVVALTIGMAGSWLILLESAFDYMDGQLGADNWDLRADFMAPADTASVNASLLGLGPNEAEYIVPFSTVRAEASSGSGQVSAVVLACDDLQKIRRFTAESGDLDFDRAVITNTMARELEIGPGDRIRLGLGALSVDLEVGGVVYDIIGSAIYTKRAGVAELAPANSSTGAYVRLQDQGLTEEKAQKIRAAPLVGRVLVHSEMEQSLSGLLSMTMGMLYFFFVLNLFLTIAVTGSAVIISSMEREVEYATLDTLGVSRWQVAKAILMEMGVLALLSALFSLPLAYMLAGLMAVVMQDVIFFIPIILVLGASVLTVVMGAAFVMLSSFVPIRYAAKLDTESTIRERTVA